MCPVPETQTCMRASSCPWEGHRLTREREKWPRLGGSWKEPGEPLVGAFSRDELPTLAAGCASDSRSKDPLGKEVKEGSVFILWVLGCYQRFLMRNYVSIIMLETTLESPLECKEIKQVNPKGNQSCQASLSFTISQSLLKLTTIESVMPSNHLILCHSLLLLPSVFPFCHVARCLIQYSPPPQYTFGRWMWIQGSSRKYDKPYKKIYLKHTINCIKVNPAKMPCVCNLESSHRTCRKTKIRIH